MGNLLIPIIFFCHPLVFAQISLNEGGKKYTTNKPNKISGKKIKLSSKKAGRGRDVRTSIRSKAKTQKGKSLSKNKIKPNVDIKLYRPELEKTANDKVVNVILTGKMAFKSKIEIIKEKIYLIDKAGNSSYYKSENKSNYNYAVTDDDGYFYLSISLPINSKIQMPLNIFSRGIKKKFQITINIDGDRVKSIYNEISPVLNKRHKLEFGLGVNYLIYKRASNLLLKDLKFVSQNFPSLFVGGYSQLNESFDIGASVQRISGNVSGSKSVDVEGGKYSWDRLLVDGHYKFKKNYENILGDFAAKIHFLFGLQQHYVPFIVRTDVNTALITIQTNSLAMFSLGAKVILSNHKKWSYESFMRFQQPLATGSLFDIDSAASFDGSVGAIYKYDLNWNVAIMWYGQWQEYNYTYKFSDGTPSNGKQELFYSNLEFRMVYLFN